jgi:hypothetical protein
MKSITLSQLNASNSWEFVRYSCHFEHAGLPDHGFPLLAPRVFLGKLDKVERKPLEKRAIHSANCATYLGSSRLTRAKIMFQVRLGEA